MIKNEFGIRRLVSNKIKKGYFYDDKFDLYIEGDALFRERIKKDINSTTKEDKNDKKARIIKLIPSLWLL